MLNTVTKIRNSVILLKHLIDLDRSLHPQKARFRVARQIRIEVVV